MTARKKLIALLIVVAALIFIYRVWLDILYIPIMALSAVTLCYAYSIRCRSCGKGQVFRGFSFFDIRLPTDKCYYCSAPLGEKKAGVEVSKPLN